MALFKSTGRFRAVLVPAPSNPLRSSSVSQALRALVGDERKNQGPMGLSGVGSNGSSAESAYRMEVAFQSEARALARELAYGAYRERGYTERGEFEMLSAYLESRYRPFTLLAKDIRDVPAGTISLLFDENNHLPCDQIFEKEIGSLRMQGRGLVEVTLLAIQPSYARSRELLVGLFNLIYLYARHVRGYTDFLIEVNPRHVNYYRKLLGFELFGTKRPCPRVKGAPAVLLRLDLNHPYEELEKIRERRPSSAVARSLYPYFLSKELESEAVRYLTLQQAPLSMDSRCDAGLGNQPERMGVRRGASEEDLELLLLDVLGDEDENEAAALGEVYAF